MSEPLSSHEIEDVLSSIRRLVSEELRPLKQPDPPAPPGPEKLLLTPSLRVVPERPAPAAAPAAPERPAPEPEVFFGEAAPLGASSAELYDDAGLDQGGSGLQVVIDSLSVPQPETRNEEEGRHHFSLPEASPAPADAAARCLPEVDWMQSGEDWTEEDPVPFVARPRATLRPDADPLARAWADHAEAEVRAELDAPPVREDTPAAAAVTPVSPAPQPGAFDQDEAIIDEDLLRDIVREMIREELAGTLGERITRNVRKLVRLEVNRALTTREFE